MPPKRKSSRLQTLLHWFNAVGVTCDPAVSIEAAPDGAIAVFAKRGCDIAEGTVLCTIPKQRAILSARTSPIADLLVGGDVALRLGGGLALIAATIHEMSLGSSSHWCGILLHCFLCVDRRHVTTRPDQDSCSA